MIAYLSGKKTYLIAAAIIVYQVLDHYLYGAPFDVEAILGALGLGALRAGVTKSGPLAILVLSLALSGCTSTAALVRALATDPATACVTVTGVWGTARIARTAIPAGSVTCTTDGLAVRAGQQSTPQ